MFHVGISQTVRIGSHQVRLNRLTRAVMRRWMEWARSVLPPVLERIRAVFDQVPPGCQTLLAFAAEEIAEARADLHSADLLDLWHSDQGLIRCLAFLMDVDQLDAVDLASQAVAEGLPVAEWIGAANGRYVLSEMALQRKMFTEAGLVREQEAKGPAPTWASIDRDIFQNIGLTPEQVDQMTMAELIAVLSEDKEKSYSDAENIEHARLYHKLTPKQRLQLALSTASN